MLKSSTPANGSPQDIPDVLIIGAGLSGLQAAVDVNKAGFSYLVLEATDRIGGKVLSMPVSPESKHTVDLGAAWINDTSQSCIYALAKKHGIQFQKQISGDTLYEMSDRSVIKVGDGQLPIPTEVQPVIFKLVEKIDETGQRLKKENFRGPLSCDLDKISFGQWVDNQTNCSPLIFDFMDFLSDAILGTSCTQFSALYMLQYIEAATGFANIIGSEKNGGQYLRPYTGSKSYVEALANELDPKSIKLLSPVFVVRQDVSECTVITTTNLTYYARKVIVAIPTPLYQHIDFEPKLPETKTTLSKSTKLGYYSKLILIYASPWWRKDGFSGQISSFVGPIRMSFDTSIDDLKQYSLSLFMVGRTGREWSTLSGPGRRKAAMDHLRTLLTDVLDGDKIPEPLNILEQEWSKQPWFEGAPSPVCPPGLLTSAAGRAMKQPFHHIHFVGTEMSDVWEGYMEGALRSGETGAAEVIHVLQS